jgi:hypothetical protein
VEIFLLGRTFTYMLNAIIDAQVAAVIVHALRGDPLAHVSPEVLSRADEFMQAIDHQADREQRLMVLAYTLERVNGRADYIYARLFQHRFLGEHRHIVDEFMAEHSRDLHSGPPLYDDHTFSSKAVLSIGKQLLRGDFSEVREYAARHAMPLALTGQEIAAGLRHVQLCNIRFNKQIARLLRSGVATHLPKVNAIRRASADTPHPGLFIGAAARTQKAAARWDRVFAMLLRVRYRL